MSVVILDKNINEGKVAMYVLCLYKITLDTINLCHYTGRIRELKYIHFNIYSDSEYIRKHNITIRYQ